MTEPLIRFTNVKKSFGPKVIYDGLCLDVYPGEALTIVGGSGVGKSVMLKMLIGLLRADAGSITLEGAEITTMNERELAHVRQRVAMLFQSGALFDSLNVGQNVAYALNEHFYARMTRQEIDERVAWALAAVDLPGIEGMRPSDLSGGMRKRVGLARAIALRPEVVLYDEPTTGLDPINTARVSHLISGLKQRMNITSIVVTHDMRAAFALSDRIAMVHGGTIIAAGKVDELRNSSDPRVADFIAGRAPEKEDVETLLRG